MGLASRLREPTPKPTSKFSSSKQIEQDIAGEMASHLSRAPVGEPKLATSPRIPAQPASVQSLLLAAVPGAQRHRTTKYSWPLMVMPGNLASTDALNFV